MTPPDPTDPALAFETRPRYRQGLADLKAFAESAGSMRELLMGVGDRLLPLLDAEHATIYAIDTQHQEVYSLARTGAEAVEIRLPKSMDSLAGYVATTRNSLVVHDAYDTAELARIHPDLHHDRRWDAVFGTRTRQVLAVPIRAGQFLAGVLQFINSRDGADFQPDDLALAVAIARLLGETMWRHHNAARSARGAPPQFQALVARGVVTEAVLADATARARLGDGDVAQVLVGELGVPRDSVLGALATYYRTRPWTWDGDQSMPLPLRDRVSAAFLRSHACAPVAVRTDGALVIAVTDPADLELQDALHKQRLAPAYEYVVGLRREILGFLEAGTAAVSQVTPRTPGGRAQTVRSGTPGVALRAPSVPAPSMPVTSVPAPSPRTGLDALAAALEESPPQTDREVHDDVDDATQPGEPDALVTRFVRALVLDALARGASDVHIEPNGPRERCRIRVRVDGECVETLTVPPGWRVPLVQRIKVLSDLDIAERRRPQDGRFRVVGPNGPVEVRVATLPTAGDNEDVVLRLLGVWREINLQELDFSARNLTAFEEMIASPYGIVLVVGPTGSGKTTTLHAALARLNTVGTKIVTAEDPVEIVQPGLRQVQVHPRIGFGFPEALRSFLRADPDVIMVGEMRDRITAGIAIEASLTGHLVVSTLQANSATETITRLLEMDVDPYHLADALRGVLAQRLVRRLCTTCREAYVPDAADWNDLVDICGGPEGAAAIVPPRAEVTLHRARGCTACGNQGYKGRVAIHELLPGSGPVKAIIRRKASVDEARAAATAVGMLTLAQDGALKALQGITDLKQVRAACVV